MCRVLQVQDCAYALAQKPLMRSLSLHKVSWLEFAIEDHPKRKWLEKKGKSNLSAASENIKLCAYA